MFGQIWSTLTRKPHASPLGPQLEPIVKYRLALYLTATSASASSVARSAADGAHARKLATP